MSEHLYPTLVADGLLSTLAADNCSTLQRQITSELDKYLQEAAEKHERYDNYYDGQHVATKTSSPQQEANFLEEDNDADSDEKTNNTIMEKTPVTLWQPSQMQDPTPGRVGHYPRGRRTTNK